MRIQTEYMNFKYCWMISSSYDFQAHQQQHPKKMLLFLDCCTVIRGAARCLTGTHGLVTGAPWLVPAAPRIGADALWRSQVFSNLSQSLPWIFCTSHQRSQLLWRPAGMPSLGLILSWNWPISVYTPHPLRYSWSFPVIKIHFADELQFKSSISFLPTPSWDSLSPMPDPIPTIHPLGG